jgi:uncharacterized protein YjaZ
MMKFEIVDTEAIYRRLLDAPDAAAREDIFKRELIEPFRGLVDVFGGAGGDGLAQYAMWGMSPEQFAPDKRAQMTARLDALAKADAWNRAALSQEKGYNAFSTYADRIPTEKIVVGLLLSEMGNPSGRPEFEYTGFGAIPGWIMTVYGKPNDYTLERVEAATVHELHHNLGSAAGIVLGDMMTITVGEYMIGEGLAESFSSELYGEDKIGPWVTEFDTSRMDETKAIFRDALNKSGFNVVRGYIFGDLVADDMNLPKAGVPPYAGYALGYHVVQAYMRRTGKKVVETSFVPAAEIIAESAFFEQ